jgi:hypothetical protein
MIDVVKIEEKIDRTAAGSTAIAMDLGGVRFVSMMELMEFAKLMAVSREAVPPHLRGNPGACLAICTRALRFNFDPFSLAEHSFLRIKKRKDREGNWSEEGTISYDSFVIRAIIQAHAPITGALLYTYEGDGDDRRCIVAAKPKGGGETLIYRGPTLGELKRDIGKNEKGETKGSPLWDSAKSDQQQAYDAGRDFCRRHFPHILLGWYDKDEFEEHRGPDRAKDVTPVSSIKDRLPGPAKSAGFNADKVATELAAAGASEKPATPPVAAEPPKEVEAAKRTKKRSGKDGDTKEPGLDLGEAKHQTHAEPSGGAESVASSAPSPTPTPPTEGQPSGVGETGPGPTRPTDDTPAPSHEPGPLD